MKLKLDKRMKLLELVRGWRDKKKITEEEYIRVQRMVSPRYSREGKSFKEIYGVKRGRAERHKLRFARSNRALLEKSKALAILRAIFKKPRCIRNIRDETDGSNSTIISRVDALEESGFITTKYETVYPHRRIVSLTRKGERFTRAYIGAEMGVGNLMGESA